MFIIIRELSFIIWGFTLDISASRPEAASEPYFATSAGTPARQAAPGPVVPAGARTQAPQENLNP